MYSYNSNQFTKLKENLSEKISMEFEELNERIQTMGVVYGEFDHPDVFDTSLSRASHIITKASFIKESNRVEGEIKLLNTYWGKEAKALVNDGCPVFEVLRADDALDVAVDDVLVDDVLVDDVLVDDVLVDDVLVDDVLVDDVLVDDVEFDFLTFG
jgi:hypothetical protein